MDTNTIFFVGIYGDKKGKFIIGTDNKLTLLHTKICIYSDDYSYRQSRYKYDFFDFMSTLPVHIKEIIFNLNRNSIDHDYFSFLPLHIEKLSIINLFIDNLNFKSTILLNNLPFGLKTLRLTPLRTVSFSLENMSITNKRHLPEKWKYIPLSDFIKLPFGCVLELESDNGITSSYSDISDIIIAFYHYQMNKLPLPTKV
jgi:hypothetical protein